VTGRSYSCLAVLLAAALSLAGGPASAAEAVYEYHIEHPTYGDIGTYSNVVKDFGDHVQIDTVLHVAVKLLGVVVHREDAVRTETWQGGRLVRFDGVTETNGTKLAIHGEARGDQFVVTTPSGTIAAPATVHPSNPWSANVLNTDMMMSAKSGRVEKVNVSAGTVDQVKFDGKDLRLKRYDIVGGKRQSVWFDDRGIPVAFRIIEDDTPIDFVVTRPPLNAASNSARN
jgi:hypothetical protein